MNTAQAYDQRLRPAQETESEKAEPLLSIQQTPIYHPMDVMIDFSRLVMDNGSSPVGFIEDIFTRLTRRLVFEFLGGHVKMEELPCLGDLEDGNDEFHRITPSSTFSKSSQFKLLDSTGNLHLSSIVFIDSDFNPRIEDYLCESVFLDSFDLSSTTSISSIEQFRSNLISQPADHTIEETHQCSPLDLFMVPETTSELMAESLCDSEGFEPYEVSVTLKISDPGYIESLGTYWPTGVVSSSFDVNDHEELLENYGFNNQDQTIDVGYTCTSPTWPGKVDGAWKEAIQMNLTDLASNKHSLNSFYDENFKNSVSSTDLEQRECAFNTSSSPYSSEDYLSQGHPCSNGFENFMGETILGTTENQLSYGLNEQDQYTDDFICESPTWPGKA
ncbi:hypothetical protein CAEBREN_07127 [Caenorhabditis brenneri]|uniref:Uncharacterized protein n=1 Tax=Caenorhabditis brenneri TaxID=135651 RepID=G0NNN0_CAEBE|nr:hypothetical protein CAEBREN_07127 [Caenorhabditis brenneri]